LIYFNLRILTGLFGDWGWGLGIGPKPQSPIPIPIIFTFNYYNFITLMKLKYLNLKIFEKNVL
jgi:hypothetical protein